MVLRIAIQGEAGSNSHLATVAMLGRETLVPCAVSAQVFQSLALGTADAAVLPIENSLHGSVVDHYDLLLEHNVTIVGETALRIRHALIAAPGATPASLSEVLSHPVALNQCRRFFRDHPSLKATPFYDTAGAVKHVIATGDPALAAIAAPEAAQQYGGVVLQRDLEDDPLNFTRFFLLAQQQAAERIRAAALPVLTPADRMSVAFAIPHRPGSLVDILQGLADAGADLTRIESRPVPGRPWEYVFFVDLRLPAPAQGERVRQFLQQRCSMFRLLGQYGATFAAAESRAAIGTGTSIR